MSADRVRQHRALTHQKLPAAMQHQARLLLFGLRRHKSHRWPRHRLTDRGRIVRVILAALEIGLHIARRHQPHRVTECLQLAAPMMCRRAGFDPDQARQQTAKELQHLRAADTLAHHDRASVINSVHLENGLRNIKTDRANLAHGRLPSKWFALRNHPMALLMPQSGAPSTAS